MSLLFNLLGFLIPLAFYAHTSELFEFNKIILIYIFTVLIIGYWLILMIAKKKLIFRRTILDVPLLLFLSSQLISTILSIDMRTSIFGYYSRFNGGLLPLLCYALLYWAFVSTINAKQTLKLIFITLISGLLVSIYGALEHFGHSPSCLLITKTFDTECWVQDVQLRVFATFGQPNWMGAWLAAVIPLVWVQKSKNKLAPIFYIFLGSLLYSALLFTKSRSAILGFSLAFIFFWSLYFWQNRKYINKIFAKFIPIGLYFIILTALIGSPWTPNLNELINKKEITKPQVNTLEQTVIPTEQLGGTESGDIRKIVWQGAWDLFKLYPIFGSGVETFGLAYYQTRPAAHNNVSEWNFLYNKAHNEYLNFLSTTGAFGFLAYSILLVAIILLFINLNFPNQKKKEFKHKSVVIALFSGYLSILVSNFFGFSVVPISFLTFIMPAMVISLQHPKSKSENLKLSDLSSLNPQQKIIIFLIPCTMLCALWTTGRYWYADTLYAKADKYSQTGLQDQAQVFIVRAINITPNEAVFHDTLANTYFQSAQMAYEAGETDKALSLANQMHLQLDKTHNLSPRNVKLIKSAANMYSNIANYNTNYLPMAIKYLEILEQLAPTDASVYYIKSLTMARLGQKEQAFSLIEKTIQLRPNYKNARLLYAILLAEDDQKEKAKQQLDYINTYISPHDKETQVVAEEYNL